jgi:hypothetical protein
MGATQPLIRHPRQQRPVRDHVPTGQDHRHQRPIALPTGVTTRPDRSQIPAIRLADQPQPVQQRPHNTAPAIPVTRSSLLVTFTFAVSRTGRSTINPASNNGTVPLTRQVPFAR